jgi:hypothetical protein
MHKEYGVGSLQTELQAVMPHAFDWKDIATRRLSCLVRAEHECAVLRDRFERLRSEHDALLLINDDRLARLHVLQISIERYNQTLIDMAGRCASLEASRSWRITAPLRHLSTQSRRMKHAVMAALLWSVRSAHLGPVFARISPALHARIRARL